MSNILSSTELTELICTRLSHDVIGNVGAVANAVELLDEGDMDFIDDIRSILKVSSSVLSARLKFFRLAFGLVNGNLEQADVVRKTAEDYLKTLGNANYPIELQLELHASAVLGRAALIGIMIAADTIIKGGTIEAREFDGKFAVVAHSASALSGEKIKNIKAVLNGERPENMAQYAPVFYLRKWAQDAGRNLSVIEENAFGLIIG